MNKQEVTIIILLFAALLGWGFFQRQSSPTPDKTIPPAAEQADQASTRQTDAESVLPRAESGGTDEAVPPAATKLAAGPAEAVEGAEEEIPAPLAAEQTVQLASDVARFTVSSRGGTVTAVQLKEYAETQDENSPPVVLDFSERPALELYGIPSLSARRNLALEPDPDGRSVVCSRRTDEGLVFERRIQIVNGYRLVVSDTLRNEAEKTLALPEHGISVGPMTMIQSEAKTRGIAYLGVDTLAAHGGAKVNHWGRKELPALFGQQTSPFSCARPNTAAMPPEVERRVKEPLTWFAAKNKFFVQILAPEVESEDAEIGASREQESGGFALSTVWGGLLFAEQALMPGEAIRREMSYFAGPKKYSIIKKLGSHQAEVMEFGWFGWLSKPLLTVLNKIYVVLPNYGIAIIVLTALVRIVFWPLTHKSTESMKKMQKLQPLVADIREKHKSNPQKMNQEVMALYKANKVNPMAGCLPMVIQIPVFIALFTVLRSAVELRFAGFLWIQDLSEPEGLLAGVLPIPLNILPLFMTATMVLQQRLTPTAGDPQQQKMMMIMPVVMLFIFYSMPAALVLYWSTSQCMAIGQLLWQRRKQDDEPESAAPAPKKPAPAPKPSGRGKGKRRSKK